MVTGINHITLSVQDIEVSFTFYHRVLGCKPIAKWPKGAYLLAGDAWIALVVDPAVRMQPLPEYTHIAFSVTPEHFTSLCEAIEAAHAPLWQENWTEGESLYFVDPNGHKLEIHASDLAMRIRTAKAEPWVGLEFFV